MSDTPRVDAMMATFDKEPRDIEKARNHQADCFITMRHLAQSLERALSAPKHKPASEPPTESGDYLTWLSWMQESGQWTPCHFDAPTQVWDTLHEKELVVYWQPMPARPLNG